MSFIENLFNLNGKVAVVTGAASGLGRDIAEALLLSGCRVVITSRSGERASLAAEKLKNEPQGEVVGMALDVRLWEQCEAFMKKVRERFGRIDILVNNAGGGSGAGECNFLLRDPAAISNMIATNLTGSIFCSKAAAKYMAQARGGRIINLGSVAGMVGRDREMYRRAEKMEQPVEYAAAKGGVIAYTRDLAAFMAPYGVTVNCISPGGFDKGELTEEFKKEYSALTPLGRMGRMRSDLIGALLYLASDASGYVTGQNLAVDGGFSSCK